jgi:hypothetical protein
MKTNLPNVFFIIGFLFSLGSCDNMFLGEEEPSDPSITSTFYGMILMICMASSLSKILTGILYIMYIGP